MTSPPTSESNLIGQVLQDTYRVERLIGRGGMGMVFGASHVRLTRRYAVKLLNPSVVSDPGALRRFQQEAEITSSLGHPNILEVFDFNYTEDGTPYIVMELLEGETLSDRIARMGRLDLPRATSIFRQAASALHAVHARGIIHRDLKPENIFLCQRAPTGVLHSAIRGGSPAPRAEQDDFVKVVDFGISKVLGARSSLTGTHALIGSPYYMSPEQAEQRSADLDRRTDVYGMGVIVYMMLCGRAPFEGTMLPGLLYNIVNTAPPSLREGRPEIPQEVEDAVMVALRKEPARRHQTMEQFWQAFSKAVTDESMGATVLPLELADTGRGADARTGDVGLHIGNYVIQRQLGQGGMGVVYLAEHPEIGRQVAIKILAPHLLQYPMAAERFVTEAKAVIRIKHPNVIDIYDFGRLEDGRLYYVMELLEGQELKDVMERRGQMTPAEVLPYLEQICAALQAAHDQNVVHRDLKPENIFQLSREPFGIKVLDFGIAKLLEPEGRSRGMTSTGMVMGSPLTMAPEQAAGMPEKIGPHTDLYSLGVVLYWMLAGLPPFTAEASGLLLAKHITERPPPLRDVEPDIPPAVAQVVDQCLEKDPANRPQSATDLLEAFAAAVASSAGWQPDVDGPGPRPARVAPAPPSTVSPTTMRRATGELVDVDQVPHRSMVRWLGLAAAALALIAAALVLVLHRPEASRDVTPVAATGQIAPVKRTPTRPPGPDAVPAVVPPPIKPAPSDAAVSLEKRAHVSGRRRIRPRSPATKVVVPIEPVVVSWPEPPRHPDASPVQPRPRTKTRSKLRFNNLDDGKTGEKPRFKDSL